MSCEKNQIGELFGYDVQKVGKNYIFGCGAVTIPVATVNNFLKELSVRQANPVSKQEKDYRTVLDVLDERNITLDKKSAKEIFSVLGNWEQRASIKPARPVKKAAKRK